MQPALNKNKGRNASKTRDKIGDKTKDESKEKRHAPRQRFLVPDLSPGERRALAKMHPRVIFVAESPHVSEITPDLLDHRRPLCGMAGRQWWSLLSELLEGQPNPDVGLDHLLGFCLKHRIAVMNAVQYPLDPKVVREFPEADPVQNLGFNKVSGDYSFKKLKESLFMRNALDSLKRRLNHPDLVDAPIHCLGNDAEWFVTRALGTELAFERVGEKIPHPSAWWRRGGLFGKIAREKLFKIFENSLSSF